MSGPLVSFAASGRRQATERITFRLLGLIASIVMVGWTPAGRPLIWVQAGSADFTAGEAEGVTVGADGGIRLAPPVDLVHEASEPRLWGIHVDDSGTVYLAPGEEGRVLRVRAGAEPELVATLDGAVQALARAADGGLLIASGPEGSIHRLAAGAEEVEAVAELGTTYVWALAATPSGDIYAGTGEDGRVVRVASDGSTEIVFDAPEPHVTTITQAGDGSILFGTSGPGRVYRLDPSGDVFVLFESALQEITALVPRPDAIWVGAFGGASSNGGDGNGARPSSSGTGGGAVYRIVGGAFPETVWSADTDGVHALAAAGDAALVGTGPRGRLLRVQPDGSTSLLLDLEQDQIIDLQSSAAGLWVATSNGASVRRVGDGAREQGELRSAVKDTGSISTWGDLRWRASLGGGSVELATRSGNTSTPDTSWSDWQPAGAGAGTSSPPARFVQWKATLRAGAQGPGPVLQGVELAYVPGNLAPLLETPRVHPPGVVYRQNASFEDGLPFAQLPPSLAAELASSGNGAATAVSTFLGRPLYVAGLRTFTWQGSDPNGDEVLYAVAFRGVDEVAWKPLATELSTTSYILETDRVPDGRYQLRVTASDAPSHAEASSRETHAVAPEFVIDNSAPRLRSLSGAAAGAGAIRVTGEVADATSFLQQIRYSVDGARWRTVLPADGATDSATEALDFTITDLPSGEHTIVVQAIDTLLNRGAGKLVVEIR